MKKLDVILLSIALVLIVVLLGGKADVATNSFDFSIIVRLILALFLLFYILGWKLQLYEDKTFPRIKKILSIYKGINNKLHQTFQFLPSIEIGNRLKIDSLEIVIISFILILLIIL
ncbi:MAG: hypothetical protein E7072_00085 [Bacteroidales bacterium]|nr:hypothetical protein [Bacteroidales bacterium]MBO5133350.1 hypothetical protein [Paludibacteraceae bacterium]